MFWLRPEEYISKSERSGRLGSGAEEPSPKTVIDSVIGSPKPTTCLSTDDVTDKAKVGYKVGSGLIFHVIKDYISIEGTVSYNILKISFLEKDIDGFTVKIPQNYNDKKLLKGGFSAILQLNIGVPL